MSERDPAFEPTVATPGSALGESRPSRARSRHEALAEDFVGKVLGERYALKRIVGAGGFGAVFEAEDQRLRKRVAVKLLFADLLRDHEAVIRFKLEAEAASQVGHLNIIDITDFDFTEDGVAYMVMEFLEGEDLAHIVRSASSPDLVRVVQICLQACRGLGAAHHKGIVHRDLKPGNLFVARREGEGERVKVVDFGISRASELDPEGEDRLTKTGQILGTPYYMAPEQADGIHDVDGRADIYAMGVILYEGTTGKLPFLARTPIGLITKHASETPRPPRELNPEIPPILENTILKALEKKPGDRFTDAGEMEQALLGCLLQLDPTAGAVEMARGRHATGEEARPLSQEALDALTTPPSTLNRPASAPVTRPVSSRRWSRIAIGGVLFLILGAALWTLRGRQAPPPPRASSSAAGPSASMDAMRRTARTAGRRRTDASAPRARRHVLEMRPRERPRLRVAHIRCKTIPSGVEVTGTGGTPRYGTCPGILRVGWSKEPVTLTFRHRGYIRQRVRVTPDHDQVLPLRRLTSLRRAHPGGNMLPDGLLPN